MLKHWTSSFFLFFKFNTYASRFRLSYVTQTCKHSLIRLYYPFLLFSVFWGFFSKHKSFQIQLADILNTCLASSSVIPDSMESRVFVENSRPMWSARLQPATTNNTPSRVTKRGSFRLPTFLKTCFTQLYCND